MIVLMTSGSGFSLCAVSTEDVVVREDRAGELLAEVVLGTVVLDLDDVAPEAAVDDPAGRLEPLEELLLGRVAGEEARSIPLLGQERDRGTVRRRHLGRIGGDDDLGRGDERGDDLIARQARERRAPAMTDAEPSPVPRSLGTARASGGAPVLLMIHSRHSSRSASRCFCAGPITVSRVAPRGLDVRRVLEKHELVERGIPRNRRLVVDHAQQLDALGDALGKVPRPLRSSPTRRLRQRRPVDVRRLETIGLARLRYASTAREVAELRAPRVVPELGRSRAVGRRWAPGIPGCRPRSFGSREPPRPPRCFTSHKIPEMWSASMWLTTTRSIGSPAVGELAGGPATSPPRTCLARPPSMSAWWPSLEVSRRQSPSAA